MRRVEPGGRRVRRMAGLALALVGLAALMTAAAPGPRPLVAAHRGGALLWPENSLTAFRQALALGVDYLETDVHLTADGEVVILHDPTLERTTTGSGRVGALRWAEVSPLHLRDRSGRPTADTVSALTELLDLIAPSRAQLLLEIKVDADRRSYPGIEEKVLAAVNARRLAERTVVMAFEADTIRRVRALQPSIRTTYLVGKGRLDREQVPARESVRWTRDLGATQLGLDHRALDPDVVAAARSAGIELGAWTVNEEADLKRVIAAGVTVVTSDRPDLALQLLGR